MEMTQFQNNQCKENIVLKYFLKKVFTGENFVIN